jgi:hypothetical protein
VSAATSAPTRAQHPATPETVTLPAEAIFQAAATLEGLGEYLVSLNQRSESDSQLLAQGAAVDLYEAAFGDLRNPDDPDDEDYFVRHPVLVEVAVRGHEVAAGLFEKVGGTLTATYHREQADATRTQGTFTPEPDPNQLRFPTQEVWAELHTWNRPRV